MTRPTSPIDIQGSCPVVSTTFPPSSGVFCDCDCEVSEFGASTRAGPICSAAGGSGEAGRGTLRAIGKCLVPGPICVSFTTFGVASDPRCAGVGAGRLDETDTIFLSSECSACSCLFSSGLSLLTFALGEFSQLDIGVPDRDLSSRSWARLLAVIDMVINAQLTCILHLRFMSFLFRLNYVDGRAYEIQAIFFQKLQEMDHILRG